MISESKIWRIKEKITETLNNISEEEGIEFRISTFDDDSISFNSNILFTLDTNKEDNYIEQKRVCLGVGLPQNIIGMSFISDGINMTVINIVPKNKKYKVILESDKGDLFHMTVSQVIMCLGGVNMINRNANLKQLIK